jgi:hypothetical protein
VTAPYAAEDRLGPLFREHRSRRGAERGLIVAGWLLLGVATIAGLAALVRGLSAYQAYGPLAVERWAAPAGYAAAGLAAAGLGFLLLGRERARVTVHRHARGLVIVRGRQGAAIPWDDIKAIHVASVRYGPGPLAWGRRDELILTTRDGRRYRLNQSMDDFDELAADIKHNVYPTLLDAYTRAFNHAQSLPFGPLEVTPIGIHNGRKVLQWDKVGESRLERGWLVVDPAAGQSGPRLRFAAHAIPNVDVCLQLIQELTSRR